MNCVNHVGACGSNSSYCSVVGGQELCGRKYNRLSIALNLTTVYHALDRNIWFTTILRRTYSRIVYFLTAPRTRRTISLHESCTQIMLNSVDIYRHSVSLVVFYCPHAAQRSSREDQPDHGVIPQTECCDGMASVIVTNNTYLQSRRFNRSRH